MGIKNKFWGAAAGLYAAHLNRARRIARAELGTARVAAMVLLPATGGVTGRLVKLLTGRRRAGDTWRGRLAGREVSVVNTGIGTPSAEGKVFACLGVGARVLIRVDICGGLDPAMAIGDVVITTCAVPFDGATRFLAGDEPIPASPWLLEQARALAAGRGEHSYHFAPTATVDTFHFQTDELHRMWARHARGLDMETSVIYHLARRAGVHALALAAVSDIRLAGLDPFGDEGVAYDRYFQGIDNVLALCADLVTALPSNIPPLGPIEE